jgi:uncharacterized membrane-anchored protein
MSIRITRRFSMLFVFGVFVFLARFALAQDSTGENDSASVPPLSAAEQQARAVWAAAGAAMVHGPSTIAFRDQAKLELPAGYGFVPHDEAAALMRTIGNRTGDDFIGLIFPEDQSRPWFVSVAFEDSGYVKDDDAKNWNADELLQSLKDGTEAGNAERAQLGIPALQVTRWVEEPKYESSRHQLVWSAEATLKDREDPDPTINYNTYALGREGHISMNLVTTASTVDIDKPAAQALLSALEFNDGKRYSDFDSSTDKVAAYGLAALVAGVAAKKLGLLALAGAFFVKFAKVIVISAAALGGGLWSRLRGRGKDPGTPV